MNAHCTYQISKNTQFLSLNNFFYKDNQSSLAFISIICIISFLLAWFNHFAGVNDAQLSNEDALRKRLQMQGQQGDESERDGSDSSCSESIGGSTGAFRPTTNSPKDSNNAANSSASYPAPNISVGPPIHPPPHLLPYLYPHGIYPPHHLSLLHNPAAAMNPNLNFNLFNAQFAQALASNPFLHGHYSGASIPPLHLKANSNPIGTMPSASSNNRFAPYNLASSGLSAFEPPSKTHRSLSSSPRNNQQTSPIHSTQRPISVSPTLIVSTPPPHEILASNSLQNSPSELKSIEKMVNGLDMEKANNGTNERESPRIDLVDQ